MPVKYPRPAAGTEAAKTDNYSKREKNETAKAHSVRKPKIYRPTEPVTGWFLLQSGEPEASPRHNDFKAIHRGTKKECMDALVSYVRNNPNLTNEVFLAHGLKII